MIRPIAGWLTFFRTPAGGLPLRPGPLAVPLAALMLLWPAVWNRYPIVFADTGTYLTQAIHRYAGWDRPVFYSVFIFPLHLRLSLWPVVIAQALLTAWLLRRICRLAAPALRDRAFLLLAAALASATWLPWLVSEVMPDLFTPLLVLVLWALEQDGIADARPSRSAAPGMTQRDRLLFGGLAACMIATQQSSLPLSVAVIGLAWLLRAGSPSRSIQGLSRTVLLPPLCAVIALCSVNLAAHGRFSVSPFGNIFLLARVLYDGPGMEALQRDCPVSGWRLCAYRDRMPDSSDAFLWTAESPLNLAGGPKRVSAEADAIIQAGVLDNPLQTVRAALGNAWRQLTRFDSGDGLNAWPAQVTPTLTADFPPAEAARYAAARQQAGTLAVPPALRLLYRLTAIGGIVAAMPLLPWAWRRRRRTAGLLLIALLALPLNAAVTGALSGPHDRYQARLMWLPAFVVPLVFGAGRRSAA